jgi:hypothetical protein
LRSVGTVFGQAADRLAGPRTDTPLGETAAAVPSLQTAAACRNAQAEIAVETAAVADCAHQFSESLKTSALWYDSRYQAAAEAMTKVEPRN